MDRAYGGRDMLARSRSFSEVCRSEVEGWGADRVISPGPRPRPQRTFLEILAEYSPPPGMASGWRGLPSR